MADTFAELYGRGLYSAGEYGIGLLVDLLPKTGGDWMLLVSSTAALIAGIVVFIRMRRHQLQRFDDAA